MMGLVSSDEAHTAMPGGNVAPDLAPSEGNVAFAHQRTLCETDAAVCNACVSIDANFNAVRAIIHGA